MKSLISVIIPVYQVEKYLDRCVESVVNQTYQKLEIILVDDGSPDKCGSRCDEWAEKDSRIKVIHVKNGGAGKARNIGVAASKGDYIAFVDSDDFVSPLIYERMLQEFDSKVDVVECDYGIVESDELIFKVVGSRKEFTTEEAMREHIQDHFFKQVIWNKMYRRNVVEGILFPEGKLIDDEFWTYKVVGNAKKLIHIDDCLYAYRQQEKSVMHASFSKARLQALEAKVSRLEYISEKFPALYFEAHQNLWLSCLYLGQLSLKYLTDSERKGALRMIEEIVREYPLTKEENRLLPADYRLWDLLTKFSLIFTCKVRNILNIGF
ncbi:glycosyltransferase family 2 protein [Bariatricus sp. HCP28S3_D3]|uniref:glycosyltransferase family 2 protein n=1 Tax=Bariatricus sp. HCP28S3_D3 TaxID=3438901 RepID=UPI003F8A064B